MQRVGFTRKKITCSKTKVFRVQRHINYMGNILQCSTDVFLDETGCDSRDQIRRYGYSLIGEPPVHHRFLNRGTRISTICALSQEGLAYYKLLTATTNGDKLCMILGSVIQEIQPLDNSS